jgi:actin-like ATPase involved in cell morphogenesis
METLSQTPPELAADIYNTGIFLKVEVDVERIG